MSWLLRGMGGSGGLAACSGRVKGGGTEVPVSPHLPAAASERPCCGGCGASARLCTSPSGGTEVPDARWVPLAFSSSGSRGKETRDHSGHLCANAALELTCCVPASVLGSEVTEVNLEAWREKRQMASSWQCPVASRATTQHAPSPRGALGKHWPGGITEETRWWGNSGSARGPS